MHTFDSLHKTGSENQLSSISTSGVGGFPVNTTKAIEDVTTTLLTDRNFAQDLRTLIVPFNAGSINSAWRQRKKRETEVAGDAVWKTPSYPSTTESKDPSSNKSALNKWSLSLAPSSERKCSVFFGSSVAYIHFFFFFITMDVQVSLRAPRLIPRGLKLMTE